MSPDPQIVSVSRDALRADLAEMELRLRVWLTGQLDMKANVAALEPLMEFMVQTKAGEFTEAQRLAIEKIATTQSRDRSAQGWAGVGRWVMVLGALSVAFNIFLAAHGL